MIEIKKLDASVPTPEYATVDSAGIDLRAMIDAPLSIPPSSSSVLVPTGLAINMLTMPGSMMAIAVPRSSLGHKRGLVLGNTIGIIDQDYNGQIFLSVWNRDPTTTLTIEPNERIAQLIFVPVLKPAFAVVDEFSTESARGTGGFGSTGTH
jgi:dUTP pyrophosphatase